jgi:cytochrome P450
VPLFHSAALASYAPMMNAAVDRLLGKLAATARGGKGEACLVSSKHAGCEIRQPLQFCELC